MTPEYNITIKQNSDFNDITITPKEDDGSVVDLSGYTAKMQVRNRIDGTELDSLTTENDRITILEVDDFWDVTLKFPAVTSLAYEFTSGVYDLILVSSSLNDIYIRGSFNVQEGVTL